MPTVIVIPGILRSAEPSRRREEPHRESCIEFDLPLLAEVTRCYFVRQAECFATQTKHRLVGLWLLLL
jgi:hypothetical protein